MQITIIMILNFDMNIQLTSLLKYTNFRLMMAEKIFNNMTTSNSPSE